VRNTAGNKEIIADLLKISSKCETHFDVISGKTLCAFDFYEGKLKYKKNILIGLLLCCNDKFWLVFVFF
jgi:hypothetical protein